MPNKWYVYILECEWSFFYIGISQNVQRRFEHHRDGKGSYYTRRNKPLMVVWTEGHPSLSSARKREIQLKHWTRRKKLASIRGDLKLLKKR